MNYLHIQLLNIQLVVCNRRQQQNCPFQVSARLTFLLGKSWLSASTAFIYLFCFIKVIQLNHGAWEAAAKGTGVREGKERGCKRAGFVCVKACILSVFAALQHTGGMACVTAEQTYRNLLCIYKSNGKCLIWHMPNLAHGTFFKSIKKSSLKMFRKEKPIQTKK